MMRSTSDSSAGPAVPISSAMPNQDLTQEELTAVAKLLRATITNDRYPLSPRLKPLKSALAKLNPAGPSMRSPLPPPKPWTNSSSGSGGDEQQRRGHVGQHRGQAIDARSRVLAVRAARSAERRQ